MRDCADLDRALLHLLVDAHLNHVLVAGELHANTKPMVVLVPDNGKTKTGRLLVYVRAHRSGGVATHSAVWLV